MFVRNNICTLLLVFASSFLFITCKKNNVDQKIQLQGEEQPDLSSKVTASVSGFVTNENNAAVEGANVQYGSSAAITDQYGYFEIKNAIVTKLAAFVTVNMNGYFKGIKTFTAAEGKENFCRIKLIPKTNTGNINAANGGDVTLVSGLNISIPANGVMNAATHASYNGTVHVATYWIDPTSNDLEQLMPGDLRGINSDDLMRSLTTYGMAAVELTNDAGELLQIAAGKKATLTIPIPSTILANAPSTIPLWYFDESIGLWKEEGVANKSGNNYTGEVAHFSFWNCDEPSLMTLLDCIIVDGQGNPLGMSAIKITAVNDPVNYRTAYTDANGYVSGYVPKDEQLILEVINESCSIYSFPFSTVGQTEVHLGNIVVPALNIGTLTGTVFNCNNQPVTNGRIISKYGNRYLIHSLNNNSTFNFSEVLCDDTTTSIFIAEDLDAFSQSAPVFLDLVAGTNISHDFQACNAPIAEFISYTIDNTQYFYETPAYILFGSYDVFGSNLLTVAAQGGTPPTITIHDTNPGVAGDRLLNDFADMNFVGNIPVAPITVHLTQYGQAGELIQGYFEGDVHMLPSGPDYHITCSFRVKRVP